MAMKLDTTCHPKLLTAERRRCDRRTVPASIEAEGEGTFVKVFWSWQSDTPRKIARHFVREALELAIARLREPPQLEEPTERDAREAIHLDHDRKDVAGSPRLAETIFQKILASTVVVADVTGELKTYLAPYLSSAGGSTAAPPTIRNWRSKRRRRRLITPRPTSTSPNT